MTRYFHFKSLFCTVLHKRRRTNKCVCWWLRVMQCKVLVQPTTWYLCIKSLFRTVLHKQRRTNKCVCWWLRVMQCNVFCVQPMTRYFHIKSLFCTILHKQRKTLICVWLCGVRRCLRNEWMNVYSATICQSGSQIRCIASTELLVALKDAQVRTGHVTCIAINSLVPLMLNRRAISTHHGTSRPMFLRMAHIPIG